MGATDAFICAAWDRKEFLNISKNQEVLFSSD